MKRLDTIAIRERRHRRLGQTYDAEYLALAALLGAKPATFDRRMLRAAERLGIGVHALA